MFAPQFQAVFVFLYNPIQNLLLQKYEINWNRER